MKSIIQNERACLICGSPDVEEHHIFGAFNRKHSEKYGLKVYLCRKHHTELPTSPHRSADTTQQLHEIGQRAFEEIYPNLDFMQIFGRNYL